MQSDPKTPENRRIVEVLRAAALVIIMLLSCGYLVAVSMGFVASANRFTTSEIWIGIGLIMAVLLVQSSYVIKELGVGPTGVSAKFERMEKRQDELETEMQALQVALMGVVTTHELTHLQKLAAEGEASVKFSTSMVGELKRLHAIVYIVPLDSRGLDAIEEDHGSGEKDFDLKKYVSITQQGRQYLSLREQVTASTAARKADTS
jgi:hypothetical protein